MTLFTEDDLRSVLLERAHAPMPSGEDLWQVVSPRISRSRRGGIEGTRLRVRAAVAFAAAVAVLLVLVLGVGIGGSATHPTGPSKSVTATTSHKSSVSKSTVNPLDWTPDPFDPGYACKEGTANEGTPSSLQEVQTIICAASHLAVHAEGPLADGVSDEEIAQDLDWSYVPEPGGPPPLSSAPTASDPLVWTIDRHDPGWACRLGTVAEGTGKSMHNVWALECRMTVREPAMPSPLNLGLSDAQIAKDLDWVLIPPGSRRIAYPNA
jgi:hypothetical protein